MAAKSETSRAGPVIVVGYDGSANAKAAVDHAAAQAGPKGCIYVVHAYAPPSDVLGRTEHDRILRERLERAEAVLDGLALADDAVWDTELETELLAGSAADAILRVAEARKADEIVVGSRGRGRITSAALGSVSHEILERARVPVLVVPHSAGDGARDAAARQREESVG